ncbi:MAG: hypothetical protein KC592_19720, partial [Nitrospira sp.]|nr:hypothetical protein [Nitrospira sp.]
FDSPRHARHPALCYHAVKGLIAVFAKRFVTKRIHGNPSNDLSVIGPLPNLPMVCARSAAKVSTVIV